MIERYRASLPGAELVVFDNNSTDGTGEIARGLGVRVIEVPEQGKGHAVRAALAALSDFDVVVLTDGDGTYPAEAAPLLVGPLVVDAADMAVGARRACAGAGAMSLTRGIGNSTDPCGFPDLDRSGYHRPAFRLPGVQPAVSHRQSSFARAASRSRPSWRVRRLLNGFASSRSRFLITPRIAGTQSKLRAFRDGRRILMMILFQSLRLRPHRPLLAWLVPCVLLALTVHRGFAAVGGLGIMVLWGLLLVDLRARR